MRAGSLVPALLLMFPGIVRADVLDVGGPTPDFAQISHAVAAAADGDVIRVYPGSYLPFTVHDKALSIVRATPEGQVLVQGTIRIQDLAAARDVELTGISASGSSAAGLLIGACAGSVRVREGAFLGAPNLQTWPNVRHPGVRVEASADVTLVYCAATGGPPSFGEHGSSGAAGLRALASRVSVFSSVLTGSGGLADDDPGASGGWGGHGVEATGPGALFVSGTTLKGGKGGNADFDQDIWTGMYGWGGQGGWGHSGDTPAWLRDVVLEPGEGGWSPGSGQSGAAGQATAGGTLLPGVARVVRSSWLLDDVDVVSLRCEGEPGEAVWLVESKLPGYQLTAPLVGPLLVGLASPPLATRWRLLGEIGADGVLLASVGARDLQAFGHETLHYQAVLVGPGGGSTFSSPSWSVRLDAAW